MPSPVAISAVWKERDDQWMTPGNEQYLII